MAYNDKYRSATQLTAKAQVGYEAIDQNMPLASLFPTKQVNSFEYDFARLNPTVLLEAEYREPDAEPAVSDRGGSARLYGRIPAVALKSRLSELDFVNRFNDAAKTATTQDVMDAEAVRLGESVARRMERGRVSALLTGKVSLVNPADSDKMIGTVDFGREPNLSTTADWSAANADVFADVNRWVDTLRSTQDVTPSVMFVSGDVFEKLRANENVRNTYYAGMATVGNRVKRGELSSVFADETPLVSILNMSELYTTKPGLGVGNPWPNGVIALAPAFSDGFGETRFGITPLSTDPKFGFGSGGLAGLMAHAFDTDNGVYGYFVQVDAYALPIMPGVNQVLTATITL